LERAKDSKNNKTNKREEIITRFPRKFRAIMNKKIYSVYLDIDQIKRLNDLANKKETTVSNLIRKSINQLINKHKSK
jgi:hypothetical protein